MQFAIRADASLMLGGGHVMRCLSLAEALVKHGHDVTFICAATTGHLGDRISAAGHGLVFLPIDDVAAEDGSVEIEILRSLPLETDIAASAKHLAELKADWVVLDHYGLGGAWVQGIRSACRDIRVFAFDDLDAELYSDISYDPAHMAGQKRRHPPLALLGGAQYVMLRSEFAARRPAALARRANPGKAFLISPGMMDAAGLAPAALRAVEKYPECSAKVVMGALSQSRAEVEALVEANPNWTLALDATDVAQQMEQADYCIGAGGGTMWERACMGLPSVSVAVSSNQVPGVQMFAETGATIGLGIHEWQEDGRLDVALETLFAHGRTLSEASAQICDGLGADRVARALSGHLRPVAKDDAEQLFEWRNQPRIRSVSNSTAPLVWETHAKFVARIAQAPDDGIWLIYHEAGVPLGHVNARIEETGIWRWGFYIGPPNAPKGAGRRMLIAFLRHMLARPDFDSMVADVTDHNEASIKLHQTLGFAQVASKVPQSLEFRLDRCDIEERLGLRDGS